MIFRSCRMSVIGLMLNACIFLATPPGMAASEDEKWFRLMDRMAASQGIEAVRGESFPANNPYGSFGSPYVLDFIGPYMLDDSTYVEHPDSSVLFLARKRKEPYKDVDSTRAIDLIEGYEYFLVFAVRQGENDDFEVRKVMGDMELKGMSEYHFELDVDDMEFRHVDSRRQVLGSEIRGDTILISGRKSTRILIYHKGSFFVSDEAH